MNARAIGLIVLVIALCLLVPLASAQDDAGVPASAEDAALLSAALSGISAESSYAFDLFLDTQLTAAGTDVAVTVEGEGVLDVQGNAPALSLDLRGRLSVNGQEAPVDFGLRIKDGALYVNNTGASEADGTQWLGVPLDAAPGLINASLFAPSGQTADAVLADLSTQLNALLQTFADSGIPPESFLSLMRLPDGELDGFPVTRLVLNVDLPALALTDNFVPFLNSLPSDPSAPPSAPVTEADARALASVFEDTAIQLKVRIDPASSVFRSGEFIIDSTLDPAIVGESGDPIQITFDLLLSLKDIGRPQTVSVPEGATVMSEAEIAAALAVPTQPTPAPVQPTPTPAALVVATQTPVATGSTAQELLPNVPVQVTVSDTAPADLSYTGAAGEIVTLSARSLQPGKGLDPVLTLFNEAGVQLARNDDLAGSQPGFGNLDSVIPDIKLPDDARYTVRVESLTAGATGTVEVLITSSLASGPSPTPGTSSGGVETVTRSVTSDAEDCVDLPLQAGETVTLTTRALDAALDTQLTLFAPDGSQVAFNDDHSSSDQSLGRFDSQVSAQTVRDAGTYSVCVSGFAGSSGAYELTIARGQDAVVVNPTPSGGSSDSPDEIALSGEVVADQAYETSFTAQAGDVYTIEVRAATDALDPQLGVYRDVENDVLFYNDDSGGENGLAYTDSRLANIIIPDSGVFDVLVTGYDSSAGPFELTIIRTATNAPFGAPETQTISNKLQTNGVFSTEVTLPEGAYVTITVRAGDDTFDPQLTLIGPDGSVVASNDDHSSEDTALQFTDSRIRNFFVTAPGTYTIEIQGYQGTGGPFSLTIDTLQ